MKDLTNSMLKNLHLLLSVIIVIPIGIIYGSPAVLAKLLDIQVSTIDMANMLKANMMLYLGISGVWILGIWKSEYWKRATDLNILFMLTLATGRIVSVLIDGPPTLAYILGLLAELAMGLFSIYQLKKYKTKSE
ncbi:DUF4345 domain-containing protein [Pedobacter sp. MW01-1-1]|uniref:DUF4345 domain-containing protein n=1 Tax=Pedobacter sp. MW01-1-1 TaxID=3383027 RepID=UPI003FEF1944